MIVDEAIPCTRSWNGGTWSFTRYTRHERFVVRLCMFYVLCKLHTLVFLLVCAYGFVQIVQWVQTHVVLHDGMSPLHWTRTPLESIKPKHLVTHFPRFASQRVRLFVRLDRRQPTARIRPGKQEAMEHAPRRRCSSRTHEIDTGKAVVDRRWHTGNWNAPSRIHFEKRRESASRTRRTRTIRGPS